jgi:hypothetical protein
MNFRPLVLSFDLNFQGDAQNIFEYERELFLFESYNIYYVNYKRFLILTKPNAFKKTFPTLYFFE